MKRLICAFRGHVHSRDEWGYPHGSGVVDLFCDRCGRLFDKVPLDLYEYADDVYAELSEEEV